MTKIRFVHAKVGGLVLSMSLLAASVARGDLLDEEVEPSVTPRPEPKEVPAKEAPVKGSPKAPEASPKPSAPSKGQTVLAPKNNNGKGKTDVKKERLPVHFQSKGLKGLREKGTVELVDDVVVTQGDFKLEADYAQVFFDEAAKDVVKVIADGNVKIFNLDATTGEKMRVFANQGTFLNRDRIVVADGNVRLWRGEDSVVRMKKATYEMDTGWIRGDRVAGELSPTDNAKSPSPTSSPDPKEPPP